MANDNKTKKDKESSLNSANTNIANDKNNKPKNADKAALSNRLAKKNKTLVIVAALISVIILALIALLIVNQAAQQKTQPAAKEQQKQQKQKKQNEQQKQEDRPQAASEEVGTPVCPSGYKIDGDACTRTTRIAATVVSSCPPGTDDIGRADACGTYAGEAQPYQECPAGTIFETEAHTKLYCFTKVRTNIESCGEVPWSGSFLDKKTHKCYYAAVEAHRLSRCPAGQVVHKNRCYQPKPKRIVCSCPAGYILDNRECVMVEKTDQKKLCPKDYIYNEENNKCLKYKE